VGWANRWIGCLDRGRVQKKEERNSKKIPAMKKDKIKVQGDGKTSTTR